MPPQVVTVKDASKVATALANETCQHILEYLRSHEDATESALAKELKKPLSTVHYNMKTLVEAKLVLSDTFTYSSRGKTITHYRINPSPIVIVQHENQLGAMRAMLLSSGIVAAGALAFSIIKRLTAEPVMMEAAAMDASPMMMRSFDTAAETAIVAPEPVSLMTAFLLGALSLLVATIVIHLVWRKPKGI